MYDETLARREVAAIVSGLNSAGYKAVIHNNEIVIDGTSENFSLRRSKTKKAWSIEPYRDTIEFRTIFRRVCRSLFSARWENIKP